VPWHALATCRDKNTTFSALVLKNGLFRLSDLATELSPDDAQNLGESDLESLIENWDEVKEKVAELANKAATKMAAGQLQCAGLDRASLCQPFQPTQIFAAASNYVEHANEMGTVLAEKPESKPYMFIKALTSTIGPNEDVIIPAQVTRPDWEVELGVVIGRCGRRIALEDAMDHVAGYTIINDVSARDQTRRSDYPFKFDWFQGKSFDTFAPIGPWFVPASCIKDPQSLKLGLDVNGESMQDGSAAEMIWNIKEQVSYLSSILTLQAGSLIATGTPTGVGMGRGIFLKDGDTMRAWVEGIGELVNPVKAEVL
jgi:2-keto-4-pentenoate hydratase/2-oxohepta-3-ene-1,7-dioic acid hydratase in catechol pathway